VLQRTTVRHLVIILGASTLAIGAGLGSVALWEPDEPRFAEASRQMLLRGDFLTPYLNGVPRFEKPILLYWLQAFAYSVFGVTEFAARLPSALAGLGTIVVTYLLTARVASRRAALIAALALATMFRFVTYARQGLTDVPVLFFVTAAVYGFVVSWQEPSSRWAARLGWLCVGLGMLTKGPVGLLPVMIWIACALVVRDREMVWRTRPVGGAALAMAVGLPWYLAMLALHGRAYTDFAIGHELVERFLSERTFEPTRSAFYYFKVWPGDAAPWSLLFLAAAAWALRRWQTVDAGTHRAVMLAATWYLTVFVAFSISRSKVTHYVLPAYPAAALLIGTFLDRLANTRADGAWWRVPLALIALTCLAAAPLAFLFVRTLPPGGGMALRWVLPGVLALGGASLVHTAWRGVLLPGLYALPLMLTGVFALVGVYALPAYVQPFKPMPPLARVADRLVPPGASLGLLGRYGSASLIYYSRRNVQWLDDDAQTIAYFSSKHGAVGVMPLTDFQRLSPQLPKARPVASAEEFNVHIERLTRRRTTRGRAWVLVANQDVAPQASRR
jgi:4-amino-4-deoxy-L-arabinose transferase-like glycosyltransferase